MSAKGDYVGELNCSSGYRQGWGEMRWANGTFYGPGNIFIYSQGDRYFGQWIQNKQEGEWQYKMQRFNMIFIIGKDAESGEFMGSPWLSNS